MSTDKTLADVQPGGRVQVMPSDAARALLAAQYRDDGDKAKAIRINHKSLTDSDKRALRAIEAALSAQPSPGGQGELRSRFTAWVKANGYNPATFASGRYMGDGVQIAWEAVQALAARQPVGQEPVAYGVPDGRGGVKFGKGWAFTKQAEPSLGSTMPLYTTAQAVDLGKFREAVQEAYDNADGGTPTMLSLGELLDLIDSRDSRNG